MVRIYSGIAEKGKGGVARQGIGEPIDWQSDNGRCYRALQGAINLD